VSRVVIGVDLGTVVVVVGGLVQNPRLLLWLKFVLALMVGSKLIMVEKEMGPTLLGPLPVLHQQS